MCMYLVNATKHKNFMVPFMCLIISYKYSKGKTLKLRLKGKIFYNGDCPYS